MEFVEDPSASEMLVEGPAGSGKTSSIRVSINELPKAYRSGVVVCAPTNKAVKVARELSGGLVDTTTIYKLLSLSPQANGEVKEIRQGENAHQKAAVYRNGDGTAGLADATQLHGKEMSYNNYVDADAAHRAAYDFEGPAVAIIKHANPCGIAVGSDVAEAHRKAHACDPVSAFGGVIAANRPVTVEMAEQVAEIFTEVIVAPAYEEGAVEVLQGKKNIRILIAAGATNAGTSLREIDGGMLLQQEGVERIQAVLDGLDAGRGGLVRHTELVADRAQQFGHRELGVEDVGHIAVRRYLLQKAAADGGLAGADLAGEQHEAAARVQAVEQMRQRLAVPLAHEQVARIGGDGERRVLQAKERGVHGGEDTTPTGCARAGATRAGPCRPGWAQGLTFRD